MTVKHRHLGRQPSYRILMDQTVTPSLHSPVLNVIKLSLKYRDLWMNQSFRQAGRQAGRQAVRPYSFRDVSS
jgi:hypothetical protein